MWAYSPPLRDMRFVIEQVLGAPEDWAASAAFADLDADTAAQVLEQAGRFASEVIAPINGRADLEACHWHDGRVRTPAGYAEAYQAFVDGGWPALACAAEHGGQGLPQLLNAALYEMLAAANHGWTMYPGLLHGAYECLAAHGSKALQDRYLDKLVSGEWLSTMCLTEPQAGSDLGAVRTRAEPQSDDTWRISGSKIFISGGDHDLTENIVHLVLARLPGGAAGSKGLSLMLAPKILPDGSINAIRCDGIEKKMGLKGSATCVLSFEGATGWLVGEPQRGLAAMFVMMNAARLHVGLQGLGHLEMAQQNAHRYAQERQQMRALGSEGPGPHPIAAHAAVRKTLWGLRALSEGLRVIAYWTAQLLDQAHQHPDPARQAWAEALVAVLTPVVKAFFTDKGHQGCNTALQIWGGYGYLHEYGIEQAVRDSRIAMIYEGTNEIQAIDLLQRKVLDDGGQRLGLLLAALEVDAARCAAQPQLSSFAAALQTQINAAARASTALQTGRVKDPEWPLRVADDFLHGLGFTLLAWAWTRTALALQELPTRDDVWQQRKQQAARFGIEWLLPEAQSRWARVMQQTCALPYLSPS